MAAKSDRALFDLVLAKYPLPPVCPGCERRGGFATGYTRPNLICFYCGYSIALLAQTKLFRRSGTTLATWRITYRLFRYDPDVTATNIMRVTGVTYKTAWRLRKMIKQYPDEAEYYLG